MLDLNQAVERYVDVAVARASGVVPPTPPGSVSPEGEDMAQAWSTIAAVCDEIDRAAVASGEPSLGDEGRLALTQRVFDELYRLGRFQPLLADPELTDLRIGPGPRTGFVHRADGSRHAFDPGFASVREMEEWAIKFIGLRGRRIDDAHPSADVELPEGRLHATIHPGALQPVITIRCQRLVQEDLEGLAVLGTLTRPACEFLAAAVKSKVNVLVSGGGSSGKTTMTNALGREIPLAEAVVTIEELRELRLAGHLPECITLLTRSGNVEGKGVITIADQLREAVRMRADRIIVGEIRSSSDADQTLDAMNTGHEGSITTLHANSASEALDRLIALLGRERWPVEFAARRVAHALHLVVQMRKLDDGRRVVETITEVEGTEGSRVRAGDVFAVEDGVLTYLHPPGQALFDRLVATGWRPPVGPSR